MLFKISVITPVYNAEQYLRKAVESAIALDEVGEVILVEDASPDNALEVALQLAKEYPKIKVFQHSDKGNHGAGASRNLGIKQATCDYIAFLDADDYYLPNRFKKDKEILLNEPNIDGVYSALGIHYYSEAAKQQFQNAGYQYQEFLTVSNPVSPEELFAVLFFAHPKVKGEFSTNNITVRRQIFEKIGLFNTKLRLRQDIHLWKRMAAFCNLKAGEISEPVAIRGVHEQNRMVKKADHLPYLDEWWKSLKKEFREKKLCRNKYRIFERGYVQHLVSNTMRIKSIPAFLWYILKNSKLIKQNMGFFDLNFFTLFGRNWFTLHFISFKNRYIFKNN